MPEIYGLYFSRGGGGGGVFFVSVFRSRDLFAREQADMADPNAVAITVDVTLLFRAALPNSLGIWVLAYEVANYVAN